MSAPPMAAVFIAISADGYIARPDGRLDWLDAVQREGEDYGYQRFFDSVDALVLGRRTWDTVAGFDAWPYGGKRVVVLTHRPLAPRADETTFAGTPAEILAHLGRDGARRVYVDGGAVIQQFLAARLVGELTLSVIPVILGAGIRLFGGGEAEERLTLIESRGFASGLVQLRYRVGAQLA